MQFEDADTPGKYLSMTCNAGFDQGSGASNDVTVGNFYGDSLTVAEAGTALAWDAIGTASNELLDWWQQDAGSAIPNGYKTEYVKKKKSM